MLSCECGNAVARIRLDGNISPLFTFRFDGIRFDGRTPLSKDYELM
jgi:hypothetical protein